MIERQLLGPWYKLEDRRYKIVSKFWYGFLVGWFCITSLAIVSNILWG